MPELLNALEALASLVNKNQLEEAMEAFDALPCDDFSDLQSALRYVGEKLVSEIETQAAWREFITQLDQRGFYITTREDSDPESLFSYALAQLCLKGDTSDLGEEAVELFLYIVDMYKNNPQILNYKDDVALFKAVSSKKFGDALLEKAIPQLLATDSLDTHTMREMSAFFLETYAQDLFEMMNDAWRREEPKESDLFETENQAKIQALQSCPAEVAKQLRPIMAQLKRGVGHITYGEETAAKFILAAIRADKEEDYTFLPTLVPFLERRWADYLQSILKLSPPIREKFIIMGGHWSAGEIEVQDNGNINIFVADSLGKEWFFFDDLLRSNEVLKDHQVTIYIPVEQRQHAETGCSEFALDDSRHLHTIERYMKGQTLFEYLEAHVAETESMKDNMDLKVCTLPHALLRTMQSTKLLEQLAQVEVQVVNKAGKGALDSAKEKFQVSASQKLQNKRLDHKMAKMTARLERRIERILQSEDPQQAFEKFKQQAAEHTLDAFQARAEQSQAITALHKLKESLHSPGESLDGETDSPTSSSSEFPDV